MNHVPVKYLLVSYWYLNVGPVEEKKGVTICNFREKEKRIIFYNYIFIKTWYLQGIVPATKTDLVLIV